MELASAVAAQGNEHDRRLDRALAPGIVGGEAEQGLDEAIHERGIRLHGLLPGSATEMGRPEEIDVRGEVLAKELEPEPPAAIGAFGNASLESALGLRFHPSKLTKKLRRHWRNVSAHHPYCQTWRELVARAPGA